MRDKTSKKEGLFSLPRWRGEEIWYPKHAPPADAVMLTIVTMLAIFGSIMVFSASFAYAEARYENGYYFIERQIIWLVLGYLVLFLCGKLTLKFYWSIAPLSYAITIILLVIVLVMGQIGNGAQRWIAIGPITIQPSEIAKTTMVLMLSRYFETYKDKVQDTQNRKNTLIWGTLLPFCMIGGICLLVMLQKHLSGIIILGAIGILVIYLSGAGLRYLGYCCGAAGVGVTALALFTDYTKRRITIWLNPEEYPLEGGWQTLQGMMAIGHGGFFGLGLGESKLKYSYVSEPANDMIFTIVCEELGFLGALFVVILFSLFIWRGFHIGLRHPSGFARLVVLGITVKVAIQVLLNIAVVANTIPNTGISLPFFSYGGSSLIMLMAEMGIICSISRTSTIEQ